MRSFLAVMEHGTLGRAARALASSQPTVGRHVKQLELQLGVSLFEQRGPAISPTSVARELAEVGREMAGGADSVARLVSELKQRARGSVRISASRMMACHLLPAILARLQQEPGSPVIELVATDEISNLVQREADIAVRLLRPEQHSIVTRKVGAIRFGMYGGVGYLRRSGIPKSRLDLEQHALIGFDTDPTMIRSARRMGLRLDRSHFRIRSDDRLVHWAAIRAGSGLGVLPTYLADGDPLLKRVLPELPITSSPVWLAVHRDARARPQVLRSYEFLRDALLSLL